MNKRFLLFILFSTAFANAAFAAVAKPRRGSDPYSAKPTEAAVHFTLPLGFPFSGSSHDSDIHYKSDSSGNVVKGQVLARKKIYQVNLDEDNTGANWRQTEEAFRQAQDMNADYILVHVDDNNAYNTASRIRSQLYHYKTPVLLYVENKNSSSNSIIPLTVDTLAQLRMAAALKNDPAHGIPFAHHMLKKSELLSEKKKGLFTSQKENTASASNQEADHNIASSTVTRVLSEAGIENVDIINYKPTAAGKIIDIFSAPLISFALIFVLFCGIYFECRSITKGPGLFIFVSAVLLLFISNYFEGNAARWSAPVFITGVLLLYYEIYFSKNSFSLALPAIALVFAGLLFGIHNMEVFSLNFFRASLYLAADITLSATLCILAERWVFHLKRPAVAADLTSNIHSAASFSTFP